MAGSLSGQWIRTQPGCGSCDRLATIDWPTPDLGGVGGSEFGVCSSSCLVKSRPFYFPDNLTPSPTPPPLASLRSLERQWIRSLPAEPPPHPPTTNRSARVYIALPYIKLRIFHARRSDSGERSEAAAATPVPLGLRCRIPHCLAIDIHYSRSTAAGSVRLTRGTQTLYVLIAVGNKDFLLSQQQQLAFPSHRCLPNSLQLPPPPPTPSPPGRFTTLREMCLISDKGTEADDDDPGKSAVSAGVDGVTCSRTKPRPLTPPPSLTPYTHTHTLTPTPTTTPGSCFPEKKISCLAAMRRLTLQTEKFSKVFPVYSQKFRKSDGNCFFFYFINLHFVNLLETNDLFLPRHCPSNVCWEIFTVCALWKKKEKRKNVFLLKNLENPSDADAQTRVSRRSALLSLPADSCLSSADAQILPLTDKVKVCGFFCCFLFSPDDKKWMTRRNKTWRSRRRRRWRAAGGCSPVLDTQRGACLPLCVCVWFYQLSPKQAKFILCVDAIVGC